jgi:AcrR family transcriptional regulator
MTMDTVASRAKASKATIYRRWTDKTGLVLDALRDRGSFVHPTPDTGSLRGDLEHYVRQAVAATAGTEGSLVVGLLAVAAHDPGLSTLLTQQFHEAQLPTFNELLDRAHKRGEVAPGISSSIIAEVLPGTLIMHIRVLGLPGDEAFVRLLLDDVLMPLLAPRRA